MSTKRTTLEVIAPTVEEAITNGLKDLGLTENEVDIEILDEGSRGLFGLGSRQVRIRLTVKVDQKPSAKISDVSPLMEAQPITNEVPARPETPNKMDLEVETSDTEAFEIEHGYILDIARETVLDLLSKMRVDAQVTAYFGEEADTRRRIPIHIDISGQDLSILIGRKAETLNALQYISMLIIGKELGRSITLIMDVEGYRKRREQQVR